MTEQERFDALMGCAKYLQLYEDKKPGLQLRSENIYQFFAKELAEAVVRRDTAPMVRALVENFPTVRTFIENEMITHLIMTNRRENCPMLDALLQRMKEGAH